METLTSTTMMPLMMMMMMMTTTIGFDDQDYCNVYNDHDRYDENSDEYDYDGDDDIMMIMILRFYLFQAFFRRALIHKQEYKCMKNDDCEIIDKKLGNCSACRLKKCFALGMSKGGNFVKSKRFLLGSNSEREGVEIGGERERDFK